MVEEKIKEVSQAVVTAHPFIFQDLLALFKVVENAKYSWGDQVMINFKDIAEEFDTVSSDLSCYRHQINDINLSTKETTDKLKENFKLTNKY